MLVKILGEEFYLAIHWDNASPQHGFNRDHSSKFDVTHIQEVLYKYEPQLVLCFGKSAQEGVAQAMANSSGHELPKMHVLEYPHPQARGLTKAYWDKVGKEMKGFFLQVKKFAMAK